MGKASPVKNIGNFVSIAAATFYPSWPDDKVDEVRGNLAIQTVHEIKKRGIPLFISDGGSSKKFLSEISGPGSNIYIQENHGLSAGRRQALTQASHKRNTLAIGLFEPEKISFIKDCFIQSLQPILENKADLVIPKRDERSFLSYPNYQASSEKLLNSILCSLITDLLKKHDKPIPPDINEIDFLFGPKVISNKPFILDLFMDKYIGKNLLDEKRFQCEIWANALFFPVIVALYKGLKVVSMPVNYSHPTSQAFLEKNSPIFIEKREYQFKTLLAAIKELILLLENNPTSRLKYTGRFYE